MSSETSTDSLQPWQLFTLAGLIGATVVVFVSRGQTPAGIVLLSLSIFAAAVVGLTAWRTFAPLSGGDQPAGPQMVAGRTRVALEREKALVLRSIKELEFDRAMGKVSERDFAEMGARLRARAAGLILQLDAGASYREEIEREIARRVGGEAAKAPARSGQDRGRSEAAVCPACRTTNDPDARFCKHCGASLEKTA
ncbi:MAG: zinc ribbon domain-containing protein [Acidobacteria bacterium]|nr:zinc ribbon domain-containing protein [Acidobacteriota bacterium]